MAATTHVVSTEEYLRTSYEHDPELIGGTLKERPLPTRLHAFVEAMIVHWFASHMDEWGLMPLPEVRTRVRPGNFRLPDVAVVHRGPVGSSTQDEPPLIAIEILSPDDSFSDLRARAADLASMGTGHVWLIDPEQQTAFTWSRETWIPTEQLALPESPIHLDLAWLWSKVTSSQS